MQHITKFSGGSIDRAAHLRRDSAGIAVLAAREDALNLLLWRGRVLCRVAETPRLAWLPAEAPILADAPEQIFLGISGTAPRFARDISAWEPGAAHQPEGGFLDHGQIAHPALPDDYRFIDLRTALPDLEALDAGDAATAKGIFGWHQSHRFCARCGQPSQSAEAGWRRDCPGCGAQHFPRTDPVVIMLVTRGNEVLLGRSHVWPPAMYSLLAGFMEPGESIEEAARREVFEETGIRLGDVRVVASQPWPFPSSLMIGCQATAEPGEIQLDPVELEAAQWVSRERVAASMRGADPDLMPARKGAIARDLLEMWVRDTLPR